MPLKLNDLNLGKVDGKHEYLTPRSARDRLFYDAFLLPENVQPSRFNNSDVFLVEGFRGTGKTSLLRWYAEDRRRAGDVTHFVLFKSDIPEQQRLTLSSETGISWTDIDPKRMSIAQDFKATWTWFIHHRIGELISANDNTLTATNADRYLKILGILDKSIYTKVLGFLPRLEGAKVKIKSDLKFFEVELQGDFQKQNENAGQTTLDALTRRLASVIKEVNLLGKIYLFFDELEVFFDTVEQYQRDQRMVRDLIFAINSLNELFRENDVPIHLIGGVRSEVIDNMGALGQEVDRVVHDKGATLRGITQTGRSIIRCLIL